MKKLEVSLVFYLFVVRLRIKNNWNWRTLLGILWWWVNWFSYFLFLWRKVRCDVITLILFFIESVNMSGLCMSTDDHQNND
jgi:hypothetical protein